MLLKNFRKKFSIGIPILLFGVVIIILAFVIYTHRQEIINFPWKINILYLLAASFFHSAALAVTFIVWSLMIYRLSGFKDQWRNFTNYYLSTLAKRVPTSLPYIGSRISLYAADNVPVPFVLNCLALENILLAISGVIFFLFLIPFYSNIDKNIVGPISVVGIFLIVISLVQPRIFIDATNWALRKFKRDEIQFKLTRKDLLLWIGIFLFAWIFAGISFYFLLLSLGNFNYPPFVDVLGISSVFTLIGLISMVFPGGFGLKEITSGAMLTAWIPFSTGLIITFANRVMQTIDDLLWSGFALLVSHIRQSKLNGSRSIADNTK